MVTVMAGCGARCRAGSYGVWLAQHCHTTRHQARPRVRIARGFVTALAGLGVEVLGPGVPVAAAVGQAAERDAQTLVACSPEPGGFPFG